MSGVKFFDSTISPAILFGLTTVPLSAAQLSKLHSVKKRMLRSIGGQVPVANGNWHDAMSKGKSKIAERISTLSSEIMA